MTLFFREPKLSNQSLVVQALGSSVSNDKRIPKVQFLDDLEIVPKLPQ